ncbi:MAG TPA: urate oxidase [Micromonosporaceae bacterium]
MSDIVLGANRYGKAEVRLVRVVRHGERHGERHEVTDLEVNVALAGDLSDTHTTGDNSKVLPTDSQKNTVYGFARDGIGEIEAFGLRLARHFVDSQPSIQRSRVEIREYGWERLDVDGEPAPHSFARSGRETRTATVSYDGERAWVVSGLRDLVLMNTTDSEFWGYLKDRYTTLPETRDRILATAVDARWRHLGLDTAWGKSYAECRRHLVEAFVGTHSRSLQQTLYAMGSRVLSNRPEIAEVRLSLPNKHHFLVDLAPFGLDNPGEVFHASDRPYGLIEGTVARDGVPPARLAWDLSEGGL